MSAAAPRKVAVVGAGAFGTALALVAARDGRRTTLLARDADVVAAIGKERRNPRYLGDILFDVPIAATLDAGVVAEADLVVLAVPAQAMRAAARQIADRVAPGTPVIAAAKGLEHGTRATMTTIIAAEIASAVPAILSGPSFATDVARGLPTALTIATRDGAVAEGLAQALTSSSFRPYASDDVVGVEIGGALKNVLAIGAGIVVGRGLGASAQAALTARGFAELARLGRALGAQTETLMGLSGLGDLVLTSTSRQSRNFSLGIAIGEGGSVEALTATGAKLAEGATTAQVAVEFGAEAGVELPISAAVAAVLSGKLNVDGAIESLMSRPLKRETE